MPAAQDHPQALEGDKGDITGGMVHILIKEDYYHFYQKKIMILQ